MGQEHTKAERNKVIAEWIFTENNLNILQNNLRIWREAGEGEEGIKGILNELYLRLQERYGLWGYEDRIPFAKAKKEFGFNKSLLIYLEKATLVYERTKHKLCYHRGWKNKKVEYPFEQIGILIQKASNMCTALGEPYYLRAWIFRLYTRLVRGGWWRFEGPNSRPEGLKGRPWRQEYANKEKWPILTRGGLFEAVCAVYLATLYVEQTKEAFEMPFKYPTPFTPAILKELYPGWYTKWRGQQKKNTKYKEEVPAEVERLNNEAARLYNEAAAFVKKNTWLYKNKKGKYCVKWGVYENVRASREILDKERIYEAGAQTERGESNSSALHSNYTKGV